jgi:putative ABC transport system permease protein
MSGMLQDLRYALRQLRKSPGFTAVAVLTLALGIGATAAIFSVVYGVLLRPLPYADPTRIVAIFEVQPKGAWNRLADPNFDDFRDQSQSFQTIAKYSAYAATVSGGSQPTRSTVAHVSPEFLKVFRVQPIIGRDLSAVDNHKGAAPVALVSYGYWKQYLGSSLDLSLLHLRIDDAVLSVVGVLPEGFHFPIEATMWIPADLKGENPSRSSHNYDAVARLRDGVTVKQANAEISAMGRRIHDASNEQGDFLLKDATVVALQDSISGRARPALLVLLGAVGFLLLVACSNVANLRLAQISVRERELAIRSALGAPRGRLVRQFATEAFVLSLLGGGFGLLGAYFGMTGLLALAPQNLPRLDEVSINLPVLIFAFLLCCGVAIGIGVFTALRATAGHVRNSLTEASREHTSSQSSQKLSRGIVAAQFAITLVLVVGAGLLGRSLINVLNVNPGFRVERIVTMDASLPWPDWADWKAKTAQAIFFRSLIERLRQIPGVRQVGATSGLPMTGGLPNGEFLPMTKNELPKNPTSLQELSRDFDILFRQKERLGVADFCVATDGYFQTLGVPLLRGRLFDDRDGPDSPHVAVISASLARERWFGQDPIGHTIEFGNMDGDLRLLTIVGVVGNVHEYGVDAPPQPTVYVNLFQRPHSTMTLTMLSDADPQQVTAAAREILHELNPEIPPSFRMFSQVYFESLGSRRLNLLLIGFFAGIALVLATAGVFGVMAFSVSRRTREIGVRVALGASSREVVGMILGQGLRMVLIGILIGLAASLALTRVIQSLLFGVTVTDPLTFAAVVLLLISAALLACYIPARRATKVDPMVVLRYE